MEYPYQGRDLFRDPENYFFADCAAPEFLDAWKTSRREAMAQLRQATDSSVTGGADYTHTGRTFAELYTLKDAHRLIGEIERYVVKYEVNKRLYSHYDAEKRRVDGAAPAGVPDYLVFGECLARACVETESLKHLSTLLKLCDALCTAEVPASLSARLVDLLEVEARLVADA